MVTELRVRNNSQNIYLRALSSAWNNNIQLYDPSVWLTRDAEVEEKMSRDADIAQAINYRRSIIAGQQWSLLPKRENSQRSPMALLVGNELLGEIEKFTEARHNLARAFFSGSRFARIIGEPRTLSLGDGRPRTWWVPVRLQDLDKRMFRIVPDLETQTARWERWNVWENTFEPESELDALQTVRHVYQDDQQSLGHGKALREALGWWWYAKTHVFQESLTAVERFAQGILTAKVDGLRDSGTNRPNMELIREWEDVLEDMRSRHILIYDAADQVETVQLDGSGWQLLGEIREELRSTITTLILGANLTTAANEGGSYALAEVQENTTDALVRYDRESLEETLTSDLLGCVWWMNHANMVELGIVDEMPKFSITQEKRQDPQERATVAATLNGMGVALSRAEVLEQTGFSVPEPGEDIIEGSQPLQPAGPGGGFPGLGFKSSAAARTILTQGSAASRAATAGLF